MEALALPVIIGLGITSILLITSIDWRFRLGLLAVQYLGAFFIITLSWPLSMAVSKLIAGWMAAAVLGMALIGSLGESLRPTKSRPQHSIQNWPFRTVQIRPSSIFYFFAAVLVGGFTISISATVKSWLPLLSEINILAGLLLIGMGILQLGLRVDTLSAILGLLTVLTGFEIIYSGLERSTLVAGLLATITLGLALVGAYLLLSPQIEEEK